MSSKLMSSNWWKCDVVLTWSTIAHGAARVQGR
jgi:hypothetical protein